METIEQEVRDTAQGATAAVSSTIETVKGAVAQTVDLATKTVHDTIKAVKHALDLERQVSHHPWAMLVGAVVAGFVLGRLLLRHRA
jgi:ElaB/YqjD/DUF883 family membrane-anchored ribosome-binding protein